MKNWRMTIGLVVMCLLAVPAYSRVTIISELHHVYGYASRAIWFDSYSITGNEPLDHTAHGEAIAAPPPGDGLPGPHDDIYGIYTSTKAGNFSVLAIGSGTDFCEMVVEATSTYELVFNATHIQLSLSIEGISGFYFVGPNIVDYLNWNKGYVVEHFAFAYDRIVPGEIYELHMYAWGAGGYQFGGGLLTADILTVDIIPLIPAPSAIVLAGIGMSMVGWRRRRRVV